MSKFEKFIKILIPIIGSLGVITSCIAFIVNLTQEDSSITIWYIPVGCGFALFIIAIICGCKKW